jgi:hypothetical protein
MSLRLKKLEKAIIRLVVGLLVFLLFAPAAPAMAETAVLPGSFTVQLVVTGVASSNISNSNATISWETNGYATSQVFYDTRAHESIADYPQHSDNNTLLLIQHSISLTGLSSSTLYHYRVKSVANVNNAELVAISNDFTFQTRTTSGGGGGGGQGTSARIKLKLGESGGFTESNIEIDESGRSWNSGQITTLDGMLTLKVDAGTRLLDNAGQPLTLITCSKPSFMVQPPFQSVIISAYDLGPNGAAFTPPITLIMKYQSLLLSPGVSENTLYIAYWQGSGWQALSSTLDSQTGTVSAPVSHLTVFALIGSLKPIQSTPTSTLTPPTSTPTLVPTSTPVFSPTPLSTPEVKSSLAKWWWIIIFGIFVGTAILTILFVLKRPRR